MMLGGGRRGQPHAPDDSCSCPRRRLPATSDVSVQSNIFLITAPFQGGYVFSRRQCVSFLCVCQS